MKNTKIINTHDYFVKPKTLALIKQIIPLIGLVAIVFSGAVFF